MAIRWALSRSRAELRTSFSNVVASSNASVSLLVSEAITPADLSLSWFKSDTSLQLSLARPCLSAVNGLQGSG